MERISFQFGVLSTLSGKRETLLILKSTQNTIQLKTNKQKNKTKVTCSFTIIGNSWLIHYKIISGTPVVDD